MSLNARFVTRVRVLTTAVCLAALIIIGRLYVLQVIHGAEYERRADAQQVELEDPLLDRGTIYFTAKDGTPVVAATLQLPSATSTASTSAQAKQRYYPGGSLAAQELGFVAYNDDNTQKGRYGLEEYYDQTLSRPSQDLYANFFVQLFGGVQQALGSPTQDQGDLITTIEPTVQAELENTLVSYDAQWHPESAGGIIMDPKTGAIVAMAVSPTFNLNDFQDQTDPSIYNNPMAQSVFEMGSIIKPLTMAAGLDSGSITPDETYDDTGCITVNASQICNYDLMARGVIPMQQILSQSLNVGASFIATQMGSTTMRDYFINHYKLGEETGIDLPAEAHGLVNNLYAPEQVDYDTAGFGQGIAITPVETIRALATLANGGYLVTPHLGAAIKEDTGVTRTLGWGPSVQVLKPQTVTDVTRMLVTVVDTAFTAGMSFQHYSVAAKTGTAQVVDPSTGTYYPDLYLHSYFGYFPAYNSRFIIFLFANKPVGAPYSSETWGTYFHSLVQFLINYYDIPPDR